MADDETDMAQLEANVRAIEQEGLVWGASKLVPLGFGIKKLQINLVVEDEKVSLDELQDKIAEDEDHVQSSDIVSFLSQLIELIIINLTSLLGRHAKIVNQFVLNNLFLLAELHTSYIPQAFLRSAIR